MTDHIAEQIENEYRLMTVLLIEKHLTISTMESCTGGLLVSLLTDTEGSSEVVRGGLVTYSNEAKTSLGVPADIIENFGVYSEETAAAMAAVCRSAFGTDIGIGITGTFGNTDPNNKDSVPGEVCAAVIISDPSAESGCRISCKKFSLSEMPDRLGYKYLAAHMVYVMLAQLIK